MGIFNVNLAALGRTKREIDEIAEMPLYHYKIIEIFEIQIALCT